MPLLRLLFAGLLLTAGPAPAAWPNLNPFQVRGLPCPRELLKALYAQSGFSSQVSERTFYRWAAGVPQRMGLPNELVEARYRLLGEHPELTELMKGFDRPSSLTGSSLKVSGGWANDFAFLPNHPHWKSVTESFGSLVFRLTLKRGLDPLLGGQLFLSDHTSMADSGWVVASTNHGQKSLDGTLKVTFFDYEMTPDGPWPRYSYWSPFSNGHNFLMHQRPYELTPQQAYIVREGFYSLRTSLDSWGLLPAETQTGYRFAEHEKVLGESILVRHALYMDIVIEGFEKKDVAERFAALAKFRNDNFPQAAREMAEVGRFNIPPGADPATKTQLFYGLTVLLNTRKIKTVVALVPRPVVKGEKTVRPSFEVFHSAPGFGWLADAAREAAQAWDLERGLTTTAKDPVHDLLRESYEALGLEVAKTYAYVFGLPNGAHVMRAPRDRFLAKLIEFQLDHAPQLAADQIRVLKQIKASLSNEK